MRTRAKIGKRGSPEISGESLAFRRLIEAGHPSSRKLAGGRRW